MVGPSDAGAGARTPRHLSHHLKVSPSQRLVPVLAAAGEAREWDGASSDLRVSPPPQPAALQPVTLLQYIIIRIQETYHTGWGTHDTLDLRLRLNFYVHLIWFDPSQSEDGTSTFVLLSLAFLEF